MLSLPLAEFHITNTCNFNCNGCNRFNNYAFVGSQRWQDYANVYSKWSKILDLEKFSILGGEPMLNPTYLDWLDGIMKLWPDALGSLTTNGHYLTSDNQRLYDIINRSQGRVTLKISLHNSARRDPMLEVLKQWLNENVKLSWLYQTIKEIPGVEKSWKDNYNAIRDISWPDCDSVDDWGNLPKHIQDECKYEHKFSPDIINENHNGLKIVDDNGVTVLLMNENFFGQSALIENKNNTFSLHNSNPTLAHDICSWKECHQFIRGKLYKCAPVALFPEFDQQFNMELSNSDRELMESYQAADISWSHDRIKTFVSNIKKEIPQCKFCPETYNVKMIAAEHGKKISFTRKKHGQK